MTSGGKHNHGNVALRWQRAEVTIAATPEDDHDAQWSAITVCICCGGPCVVPGVDWEDWSQVAPLTPLCSRCEEKE